MFNNHEDIVGIVEDGLRIAYAYGDNGRYLESIIAAQKISKEVQQQRLEYMQSQIDELQLEHCPEEMSKEQFDNWAKNQKHVEEAIAPLRHCFNESYGDTDKTA